MRECLRLTIAGAVGVTGRILWRRYASHDARPPRNTFWKTICGTVLPPWKTRSADASGGTPGAIVSGSSCDKIVAEAPRCGTRLPSDQPGKSLPPHLLRAAITSVELAPP